MISKILQLFTGYIIYPLVGIIIIIVSLIVANKTKWVKPKPFFIYTLLGLLTLALPGMLGFMGYSFLPNGYAGVATYALALGILHVWLSKYYLNQQRKFGVELFISFTVLLSGACFFALAFNLTNHLQYGVLAATSLLLFLLPSWFYKTYHQYLEIPIEVYEIWYYEKSESFADTVAIDHDSLVVIEVELFKSENDSLSTRIKAKAPANMAVGTWFKRLINDYNRKSPKSPIEQYAEADEVGWIFYLEPRWFRLRKAIDFSKSFKQNGIKPQRTIIAKRVKETIQNNS